LNGIIAPARAALFDVLNSEAGGGSQLLDGCVGYAEASIRLSEVCRLNWVDILILAVIIWFAYAAFHAGLIREVVTIIGTIFAVALAGLFYLELSEDIKVVVDDTETAEIIAFAVIFGATLLASQLLALFLKQAASLLLLGLLDSIGGAVIGVAKGIILIEVALMAALTFPSLGFVNAVEESLFAPFFLDLLPFLKYILPGEFDTAVDEF
jgi:membrane protein required for colicin V production